MVDIIEESSKICNFLSFSF